MAVRDGIFDPHQTAEAQDLLQASMGLGKKPLLDTDRQGHNSGLFSTLAAQTGV